MSDLPLENYFGDGRDGALNTTGNVSFSVDVDGPTVFKYYTSIHINAGHIVTPANRCKGMVIYCLGDCIIDGTLSMTARGANAAGELFAPNNLDNIITYSGYENFSISATGGAGGDRAYAYNTSVSGKPGAAGVSGACGGGGSGGASATGGARRGYSGTGSAGTTWSGGSGGGAVDNGIDGTIYGGNAAVNGGSGGSGTCRESGVSRCAGGGAGNNGGAGCSDGCTGGTGQSGTGGLLILVVRGNLIINETGSIVSRGSNGGSGNRQGGCSGGGGVTILYGGSYKNDGLLSTAGGAYGNGGSGGAGSLRINRIKALELPKSFRPIVIDAMGQTSELPRNHKIDASVGMWFGSEPTDTDKYPFYYNLTSNKLYFFADEDGDGVGSYLPISPSDIEKMDVSIYDPNSRSEEIAFSSDLHYHEDLELLNLINYDILDAIHSHNNILQLESFTEERVAILDKVSEHEGQPTWNNLAWPVGNPASVGAALWISDTPPADPQNFPFWWNTAELQLYVYHVDGDSSQYVEANPIKHGKDGIDGLDGHDGSDGVNGLPGRDGVDGLDGANRLWVGSEIPSNPVSYPFWWNPIEGRFLIWYDTDSCYVEANPVVHGVDGQDGANGTNGVDGQDGSDGLDGDNRIWVGAEIPANPETYPFWWNPIEGRLLVWYTAANAYVEANPVVHGVDGRDGIDGIDGAPGADGADGGIQSFPDGYYLKRNISLIDNTEYTLNTAWKLGPAWSPVTGFAPNSLLKLTISFIGYKSSTSGWGGIIFEPHIRFNTGDWMSLTAMSGYGCCMHYGSYNYMRYHEVFIVKGIGSSFTFEVRSAAKMYAGSGMIRSGETCNLGAVSGLATGGVLSGDFDYAQQGYPRLIIEEFVPFPVV